MTHRILIVWILGLLSACSTEQQTPVNPAPVSPRATPHEAGESETMESEKARSLEIATFGAGCFWCVEAVLEQLDGVVSVESGYMGGELANPTYEQVCSGLTGHAEVVRVEFDPAKISFKKLLIWFFKLHDPTTLNRQGNDEGTQYRSVVFYHSDEQRAATERAKKTIDESRIFPDPVVTEITKATTYYPGEKYHQDFYRQNKANGYCRAVIYPKLDKLGLDK
jgi:peptide-methionine (S)-S-oxide reductase